MPCVDIDAYVHNYTRVCLHTRELSLSLSLSLSLYSRVQNSKCTPRSNRSEHTALHCSRACIGRPYALDSCSPYTLDALIFLFSATPPHNSTPPHHSHPPLRMIRDPLSSELWVREKPEKGCRCVSQSALPLLMRVDMRACIHSQTSGH